MNINKKELYELVKKPLSSDEMLEALDYKCNIVKYSELKNYKNINDILGEYKKCILLYETKLNYGHWTCLYKNKKKNTIFFFDSYGFVIDDELNFIPHYNKKILNSDYRYLTKLLYKSKCNIEYNEYELQDFSPDVSTCGRWVIVRLLLNNLSVESFYNLFKNIKNKDLFITLLTYNI